MTTIEEKVIKPINNVLVKKDSPEFDVITGSHDGTELCELVGLYLLDLLTKEFGNQNIGLYIDDGLNCSANISGPDS